MLSDSDYRDLIEGTPSRPYGTPEWCAAAEAELAAERTARQRAEAERDELGVRGDRLFAQCAAAEASIAVLTGMLAEAVAHLDDALDSTCWSGAEEFVDRARALTIKAGEG